MSIVPFDPQITANDIRWQPVHGTADDTPLPPLNGPLALRLLNDVELMLLDDPTWLIGGIVPERGIVGIYGPPGAYKTTIVAIEHVAVATGGDWFGHRIE